jgi:hypothetical protein
MLFRAMRHLGYVLKLHWLQFRIQYTVSFYYLELLRQIYASFSQ